jgi:hypothetical protein
MNPCWTVRAWPPLLWQAECALKLNLTHLDTRIINPGTTSAPTFGQTLWGRALDKGDAGIAWDWVQLPRGVVAMADPLSLVTNLQLLGMQGEVLTACEAALHLNELVYGLPWQHEVERALSAVGATAH